MATTTTKTNKPILPRGADNRPVDSYNRAKLFSGKALSFDGVNDVVNLNSGIDFTGDFSFCIYFDTPVPIVRGIISDGANVDSIGTLVTTNKSLRFRLDSVNYDFGIDSVYTDGLNFWSFVRSGSTLYVYKNGLQVGSQSVATNTFTLSMLGAQGVGVNYFIGELSNLKAFNTALTAAQVADLYNNPEKVVPTGVDNTALKLWLPMQEGAGTYCINGADPLGDDLYNGAGSFDSATGWTLNTGTSITGGQLVVDGTQTSNTSAYYSISEALPNQLAFVQYTISSISSGSVDMVFFGSNTQSKIRTEVGTYTELVEVITGHNGNTGPRFSSDCVCTIDNLTIKKVDTGKINGATWTHGIGSPIAQTAVIDWNKETTGAGTTMLLPQGLTTGRDITGVNLFENVRKQGALNLDGNSWAEVHDNASLDFGTGSFSLEAWVKAEYINTGSAYNVILNLGSILGYSTGLTSGSGYIAFFYGSLASNYSTSNDGSWVHIVGTYDGTNATIYANGVQESQAARTAIDVSTNEIKYIGKDSNISRTYKDQLAQPRIYNRALTASEVLNNYNATKTLYI